MKKTKAPVWQRVVAFILFWTITFTIMHYVSRTQIYLDLIDKVPYRQLRPELFPVREPAAVPDVDLPKIPKDPSYKFFLSS